MTYTAYKQHKINRETGEKKIMHEIYEERVKEYGD